MLDEALPCTVDVAGAEVPIRTGWRTGVRLMRLDLASYDCRADALALLFGGVGLADEDYGTFRPEVSANPAEALLAGVKWHTDGLEQMRYAGKPRKAERRAFDMDQDSAAIVCDFQRLYRIDLTDEALKMHWYRFCALLLGAMRTEGSLMCQAAQARLRKVPTKASQETRQAVRDAADAWKLAPTRSEELARLARAMRG